MELKSLPNVSNVCMKNLCKLEVKKVYKNYKDLFETIKKRSKKVHYSKLINKYKYKKHGQ